MQRIGVFICWCGSNIAATVDVKKVAEVISHEQGVVFSVESRFIEISQDKLSNLSHSLFIEQISILLTFVIFHKETKYSLISNGILYKIAMQTFPKHFSSCVVLLGIFGKDRCTCKTKYLKIIKELHDVLMAISKMTTVAFIEYHHYLLVSYLLKVLVIIITSDSTIQLLNSRDYDFAITA